MAVARTFAAGWLASVLVVGALPTPTLAASPTRIDLFDPRGNRTGSAIVEGDRVDRFDVRGNRTGSGRLQDRRRVDFFDPCGNRTGYAIIEGGRIDFFDARSNRTGSGRVRDGAGETFDGSGGQDRRRAMVGGAPDLGQPADERAVRKGTGAEQCHEPHDVLSHSEKAFSTCRRGGLQTPRRR